MSGGVIAGAAPRPGTARAAARLATADRSRADAVGSQLSPAHHGPPLTFVRCPVAVGASLGAATRRVPSHGVGLAEHRRRHWCLTGEMRAGSRPNRETNQLRTVPSGRSMTIAGRPRGTGSRLPMMTATPPMIRRSPPTRTDSRSVRPPSQPSPSRHPLSQRTAHPGISDKKPPARCRQQSGRPCHRRSQLVKPSSPLRSPTYASPRPRSCHRGLCSAPERTDRPRAGGASCSRRPAAR